MTRACVRARAGRCASTQLSITSPHSKNLNYNVYNIARALLSRNRTLLLRALFKLVIMFRAQLLCHRSLRSTCVGSAPYCTFNLVVKLLLDVNEKRGRDVIN